MKNETNNTIKRLIILVLVLGGFIGLTLAAFHVSFWLGVTELSGLGVWIGIRMALVF